MPVAYASSSVGRLCFCLLVPHMSNSSDPNTPRSGGLQAMLARLKGMVQGHDEAPPSPIAEQASPENDDLPLTFDEVGETPIARRRRSEGFLTAAPPRFRMRYSTGPTSEPASQAILCPVCQSPRADSATSCGDCGYYFSADDLAAAASGPGVPSAAAVKLKDRFELGELLQERQGAACAYRGFVMRRSACHCRSSSSSRKWHQAWPGIRLILAMSWRRDMPAST